MKDLILNIIDGVETFVDLIGYFDKNPKLTSIYIKGNTFVDDNALLRTVEVIRINNKVCRDLDVDEDDFMTNKPEWMDRLTAEQLLETAGNILYDLAKGDEGEWEMKITRKDYVYYLPYVQIILNLRALVERPH